AELFALDKSILVAEKQVKTQERLLQDAVKYKEAAPKHELDENEIRNDVDVTPAVREAVARVTKAGDAVRSLSKQLGPAHPVMQAADKELADAEAALKAAREKARPEVEKKLRARYERYTDDALTRAKGQLKSATEHVEELLVSRKRLSE